MNGRVLAAPNFARGPLPPRTRRAFAISRCTFVLGLLAICSTGCNSEPPFVSMPGDGPVRTGVDDATRIITIRPVEAAATSPSTDAPVEAKFAAVSALIGSEGEVELKVHVTIGSGYYVYGDVEEESPFAPFRIRVLLPDVLQPTSPLSFPRAIVLDGGQPAYRDELLIVQRVRLLPAAAAGSYEVKAELEYQACNDLACWPPESLEIFGSIVLGPAGE